MNNNGMDEEFDDLDESVDDDLYTELDDDRRAELNEMLGLTVLGIELWDESLGDEEDAEPVKPEERVFFDCDLYLEDNLALELYVVWSSDSSTRDRSVARWDRMPSFGRRCSTNGPTS